MRFFCGLLAAGLLATACATAAEPASPVQDPKDAVERPQFFVHLNCSPRNQRAVESTLKLAKTLSNDQSDVILFLDLRAVVLAEPNSDVLDKEKRDVVEGLFEKLRCSGVEMLVCPHCAGELGIQANRIRKGGSFYNEGRDSSRNQSC